MAKLDPLPNPPLPQMHNFDSACLESEFGSGEDDIVQVNIRGKHFDVYRSTLNRAPDTKLYRILNNQLAHPMGAAEKLHVRRFNRNPHVFDCVLDYYSSGELHLPEGICGRVIKQDLEFWELGFHLVLPCCLAKLERADDTVKAVTLLEKSWHDSVIGATERMWHEGQRLNLKNRLWVGLNDPKSSIAAQVQVYFH